MITWPTATIGEVSLKLTKGTTPTLASGGYSSSGVSFVKVESISRDGQIEAKKLAYISESTHLVQSRSILQADDLLFSIAGTIGRVARVHQGLLPANTNQALAIVRPNPDVVDVGYLMYCLRDRDRIRDAVSRVVQSVQANLSLKELSSIEIALPPLLEQRAIAEVLGALDEKIAVNVKLADTADELARTMFSQAAKDAVFSGETFADVARVSGGGTPSTKMPEYWRGQLSWATPTDVTALSGPFLESTSRTLTDEGLASCSSAIFAPGAILMTSRATIGAFALTQIPTAVNQGFIVVEPNDESLRYWIFHDMRSRVDEFKALANGATFLELSRGNFKKLATRVATGEVMQRFGTQAMALHDSARHALLENRTLTELRGTLLPELMSGRLRVKDAEKKIEEVV